MPSEDPSSDGPTAEPSAEEAEENLGEARSALTFNACACIGTANVSNCSGGVCEYSTATNLRDNYYCRKTDRVFTCTRYQTNYCRATGYVMHSMTCCSGHARYIGSDLYCTAD
ncbi:hypothetical protein BH11MYX4_BH11MYX4_50720 [soil metagenome]